MLYLRFVDQAVVCAGHRNRFPGGYRELKGMEMAQHLRERGSQDPCEDCEPIPLPIVQVQMRNMADSW